MDFSDPNFSFYQASDAATGSMVTEKHECGHNTRTSEDVTFSSAAIIREIEEVHEEDGWIVVGAEETDAQQSDSISSDHCLMVESEFHEYQASRNQSQDSMNEVHDNSANSSIFCDVKISCLCSLFTANKLQLQTVEAGKTCHLNQSSYFLLGPMQIEKQNKISLEATAAVSTEPVLEEAQDNPEV